MKVRDEKKVGVGDEAALTSHKEGESLVDIHFTMVGR